LIVYLDTSVAVSLFVRDAHSERLAVWVEGSDDDLVASGWTLAEFSSALARLSRMNALASDHRRDAERGLDEWLEGGLTRTPVFAADFERARELIRLDQVSLRTPDVLHVAIAGRLGAELATVDARMADAAKQLGVRLAEL
jgi:predicted nucleic acid-binding protein